MAERRQKHFLFPIGCLRLDKSLVEVEESDREILINRIVNLHLHRAMENIDPDDENIEAAADEQAAKQGYHSSNSGWTDDEIRLLYALKLSGVNHGEKNTTKLLKQIAKSVGEVTTGFSLVAMPSKLFWQAVREWPYRDFAVLCSVWCAIGAASYRKVSLDKITRGSLGYGTAREYATKPKRVESLTRMQVRYTVQRLEAKQFFIRCPMNARHICYSKKLGLLELQHAIAARIEKKSMPTLEQRLRGVEDLHRQKPK